MIVNEQLGRLFRPKLFERISPENVTHQAMRGRFAESVDLRTGRVSHPYTSSISAGRMGAHRTKIIDRVELGRQTTMNAQELLVHDRRQRQVAKRIHASVIDGLRVLVLAFEFESEIVGQVTAFVVASKQEQGVRVPDLE